MSTDSAPRLLSDVMRPKADPSPEERDILDEVHGLAYAYADLPTSQRPGFLAEVRKLSTGYDRFRATAFTPPSDPAWRPLMAMLDSLIASTGIVQTKSGAFTSEDLGRIGAMTVGPDRIRFPVAYGKDGTAVFRRDEDAGPKIVPFLLQRPEKPEPPKPRASMWGNE